MAQEAEKPLESVDQENYDNDKAGETKLSKISNGKDEEALLIDKICLNNIINNLKEREKQIILLRYYRGKTQSEVAKMLRCNSSTNIQNRKKNITRNETKDRIYINWICYIKLEYCIKNKFISNIIQYCNIL